MKKLSTSEIRKRNQANDAYDFAGRGDAAEWEQNKAEKLAGAVGESIQQECLGPPPLYQNGPQVALTETPDNQMQTDLKSETCAPLEVCKNCGQAYACWFTENDIWNKAVPESGMLCPNCFLARAERAGITQSAWKILPEFTGTGEGSEPLTPTEELLLESVLAENAALRSQLEKAKRERNGAHLWKLQNAKRATDAERDVTQIDEALARRTVLDDFKTRYEKIFYACRIASKAEALERDLATAREELASCDQFRLAAEGEVDVLDMELATAQARIARLTEVLRELDPVNVQPPYDHDGECSYCGVKEGYKHPKDCSWRKAEQALAEAQSGEK